MRRGTGITTRQIQNAPQGAIYIWVSSDIYYPKHLARHLGREDLEIVGKNWLYGVKWHGREFTGVVVDHATRVGPKGHHALDIIRARMKRKSTDGESDD